MMRAFPFLLVLVALTGSAWAQTSPPSIDTARSLFNEGLAHAQRGELEAALGAFEAAYAASPNFEVLYNIGQARSALGHHVEAASAFERYLAEGGSRIADSRRDEVRALLAASRKRTGLLKITADAPEQTRAWLDGRQLSAEQLGAPLVLKVGHHTLVYVVGAGSPTHRDVVITNEASTDIQLAGPAESRPSPAPMGQLGVSCRVPDMLLTLDGETVAKTPLDRPLLVPHGTHQLALTRPGYPTLERLVTISSEYTEVRCEPHPQPSLARSVRAALRVRAHPSDATVFVDGRLFVGPLLPAGAHELRVEREGYLPYQKIISVTIDKVQTVDVRLLPTPMTRARTERSLERAKTLAYVLGGVGSALLLTGGGIYLWNDRRYEEWKVRRSPDTADLERVASLQRADDASLGFAVLGAGLIVGGAWSWILGASTD